MAKLVVYNWKKEKAGEVEVSDEVFNKPLRKDILQRVVRWQLACKRQGTHATKTKGLVRGGGAKPFKQKGTGNARQGSRRSPLMPGGGTIFGPQPRDYSYTLPKAVKKAALKTALSYLANNEKLFVVEDMQSEGKTKELSQRLKSFGLSKAMLVDLETNDLFCRASRNLKNFNYYDVNGVNVYDLLKFDNLVITKSSLETLQKKCGVEA